jgi:rare lipoprotein A
MTLKKVYNSRFYADIYDMKQKYIFLFFICAIAFFLPYLAEAQVAGTDVFRQEGIASWYGKEFDGRPTASGEIYDSSQLTAAHLTLPFGTRVTVTNRQNNKKVTVKINDRGPFVSARVIDVSRAAAEQLDMIYTGTAPVLVESVDRIIVSSSAMTPPASPPVAATQPVVTAPPVAVAPPVVIASPVVVIPPVATAQPATAVPPVYTIPDARVAPQRYENVRLVPEINIVPNKMYRLQIGSYQVARNAVDAFERLKNAGLNPNYERYTDSVKGEFFRVVIAGIRGSDIQSVLERLGPAGVREALIREEF